MDIKKELDKLFDDPLLGDISPKEVELFRFPPDM